MLDLKLNNKFTPHLSVMEKSEKRISFQFRFKILHILSISDVFFSSKLNNPYFMYFHKYFIIIIGDKDIYLFLTFCDLRLN